MPRAILKKIEPKFQKLIDQIRPYYHPEAIQDFKKFLSNPRLIKSKITQKSRALKNNVKSFDVAINDSKDPAKQLYETTIDASRELENILLYKHQCFIRISATEKIHIFSHVKLR